MAYKRESMDEWAKLCYDILKSDRDLLIIVSGFTGEGKSTFCIQQGKAYNKLIQKQFDYDMITWSRKELLEWIDGEKKSETDPITGLKKNQKPEYSYIVPDELFAMFYKRNWFEEGQVEGIATFNMYRDRHLFVVGNVPNFYDLDKSFQSRARYFIYIPERGKAWVFEQENNPFTDDRWNQKDNKKTFRKSRNPFNSPNFVCEILYEDITAEEKESYLQIRNKKRHIAIQESAKKYVEKYGQIKEQRNELMRLIKELVPNITDDVIADRINIDRSVISKVVNGVV